MLFPASLLVLVFTSVLMHVFNLYFIDTIHEDLAAVLDASLPRSVADGKLAIFTSMAACPLSFFKDCRRAIGTTNFLYFTPSATAPESVLPLGSALAKSELAELEMRSSGISAGNILIFFCVALFIIFFLVGVN